MLKVYLKLIQQGQTQQEILLSLNSCRVPNLKEKIAVENTHYTVTSVFYNITTEETTGNSCIDCVKITAKAL